MTSVLRSLAWRMFLPVALVFGTLAALLPAAVVTASPAAAATVRAFGVNPFNSVLDAADSKKKCGLSRDELAAIMLAPVFPEAGGTSTQAPSPMTLSRWDVNSSLWAYGNKTTPYQKAFWHPGIGLWQFDSAGGWNMIAADAINTTVVASVAAKTMADRYCASSASTPQAKRNYAWGPWYGCNNNTCEAIFNEIYDSNARALRMSSFNLVDTVGTKGGMVTRSCLLNGVAVTCYYVDPGAAQGNKGWASTSPSIPTPISAPFYDISHNGREWRVWLPQDTGYGSTISADKPITANARTSLSWSTSTRLCDVTTSRGACGRVATASWGSFTANPFGYIDSVVGGIEAVTATGWAIDPDVNDPVTVHVYVDGHFRKAVRADLSRPDVASAVPGYGPLHGFSTQITGIPAGNHLVCIYALNTGATGNENPQIGCANTNVQPAPPGPFPDVNGIHPFVGEIQWLVDDAVTTGYPDGNFWPAAPMSRGAMATFLWRAAGMPTAGTGAGFSDVPAGHPFAPAIAWLAGAGITTGFPDGTFRPEAPITREAMAAFLYRYKGRPRGPAATCSAAPFTDMVSSPYCVEIGWLVDEDVATGFSDGTFRPLETVTRQATAAFLFRLFTT